MVQKEERAPLPAEYLAGMKELLGSEYEAFLASYAKPPVRGLRFQCRKARKETIEKLKALWELKPVSWCEDGFQYTASESVRPGKSPYHDAGVFYIQEPSAMLPVSEARLSGREAVLDLCAAPGGKSTQAAVRAGFLVSNEYVPKRARILSSNIERLGIANALVTNADSETLSRAFPDFFDRVLVDAPCSGEGMMRREAVAVTEWSLENVANCVRRQREILENAAVMLRKGGYLVYSTCTFEPSENTWQIHRFLHLHPEFSLCSEKALYPHREACEGHYCAVLKKTGCGSGQTADTKPQPQPDEEGGDLQALCENETAYFREVPDRRAVEEALLSAKKRCIKAHVPVLRCGVLRGEKRSGKIKGGERYEPSHAEILAGEGPASRARLDLKEEALAERYLRGETIRLSDCAEASYILQEPEALADGFLSVCYDGYPLGAGKLVRSDVKNHYPKGLRH